jgi:hypothetical protein
MAEKEKPVKKKPTKKKKEPAKKKKETVEKKKEPKKKEPKKKESMKKDSIKKENKKENKIVVEITPAEKENNEEMYSSKLKNLLFKIKNQNSFNDTGIRFAWRN